MPEDFKDLHCVDLIRRIKSPSEVDTYIQPIVEKWGDASMSSLAMDVLLQPFFHVLYCYPDLVEPEKRASLVKLQTLFTQQWLDLSEWQPGTFWDSLGTLMEVMWQRNDKVINQVATALSGWIADNQAELEQAYFTHPTYQALVASKARVNTDFSVFYRMVCDDLVDKGKSLPWSDAFIWAQYRGVNLPEDKNAWIEYRNLPKHLVLDLAYQGILDNVKAKPHLTPEWIDLKTQDVVQQVKLATAALAHGYFNVEAYLTERNPRIARQVLLGHDLSLTAAEILDTVRYDTPRGSLPLNVTLHP